jgi:hypothetical protein
MATEYWVPSKFVTGTVKEVLRSRAFTTIGTAKSLSVYTVAGIVLVSPE